MRRSLIRAGLIFALLLTQLNAQQTAQLRIEASCSPEKDPCRLGSALHLHFDQTPPNINDNALKFELMLDDRVMTGLTARGPLQPVANKDGTTVGSDLIFDLKRVPSNDANAKAWNALLSAGSKRNLPVGLALGGNRVDGVNSTIWLDALPSWWPAIALMMAGLLAGFIALALKSDILRDGQHLPNGTKLSFSLGRTQMAWWTLIISGSFLYVWMVTQDWTFPIPGSALVLMGISATTALGSQLVDGNRNQRRQALLDQKKTLTNTFSLNAMALRATPLDTSLQAQQTQTQAKLDDVNSKLDQLPPDFAPSVNFLTDILSEDDGVSLHRVQNALWTLILGIVFIFGVVRSLSLPDFDPTLQTLMGISSGIYVGFKIPDPPKQS